jgi:pimeloyl-ACP methyl ester carboxylesterase
VTGRDVALFDFTLLIFEYASPLCGSAFDDDTLRRRTMPILAVVGERYAMLDSYQTRQRLEETAPHAKLRLLPQAGQLVPDQTATVLDFLHSPDLDRHDG